jgi:hypothetical protein
MQDYDGYQKYNMSNRPKLASEVSTADKEYTLEELQGMVYDRAAEILNSNWNTIANKMNASQIQEWVCNTWNMVGKYDNIDGYENWNEWLTDIINTKLGVNY